MDPDDTNPMSWILEDGSLLVLTTTESVARQVGGLCRGAHSVVCS